VALRDNEMCGLNVIGLRRAGFSAEERLELKRLYHQLFRGETNLSSARAEARKNFAGAAAKTLLDFITEAKRGLCADVGRAAEADDDE
jgi:UDP-N-acetylglucosamine acyltransferase